MADTQMDVRVNNSGLKKVSDAEDRQDEVSREEKSELPLDSPEFLVKHPLQNKWTLWFFRKENNRSWEDSQKQIITFSTIEDFWALYNHIEQASKLCTGCDYSLFKEGIKPMWEDTANMNGGRWTINLDKKHRSSFLDNYWLEVMLILIGEYFDEDSQIVNGAVVSIRNRQDKISMWLKNSTMSDTIMNIGRKIKSRLNIDSKVSLGFEAHEDTSKKSGSTAKCRYLV